MDFSTRYIQRLQKPTGHLESPMSTTGNFTPQQAQILAQLFTLDYMGSSEFEGPLVYNALRKLINVRDQLQTAAHAAHVAPDAYRISRLRNDRDDTEYLPSYIAKGSQGELVYRLARQADYALGSKPQDVPYYIIAPAHLTGYARELITSLAQRNRQQDLQEPAHLHESALGVRTCRETVGWLEIDNGFFFFSDYSMFARTCNLFGVANIIKPPASPTGKMEVLANKLGVGREKFLVVDEETKGSFSARVIDEYNSMKGIVGYGSNYRSAVRNLSQKAHKVNKARALSR